MKVAYLSPHKDSGGYTNAAIENILSLDSVGVEVVPRSVKMTGANGNVPSRVKELEQNNLNNIDIIVQHNLPSEFVYRSDIKNVGAFAYETNDIPHNDWIEKLKLMDKVVVFCTQQWDILKNYIDSRKISIVPHAVDITKFNKNYNTFDFGVNKDTVKFYTISEFNRRKNIPALLLAYYSKFTADDNVILIIKTHLSNRDAKSTYDHIKTIADDLKNTLKRFNNPFRYPKVFIIPEFLSENEICSLHQSCDVFVSASHGESFCLPLADAIGFGNHSITSNYGAFKDYNPYTLVDGVESPVFGVTDSPPDLYTGDELWFNINVKELSDSMYTTYLDLKDKKDRKHKDGLKYIKEHFSRESVGQQFKKVLEQTYAIKS